MNNEILNGEGGYAHLDPLGQCPKCSGYVYEYGMNYICNRSVGVDKCCVFYIGKEILQQVISEEQVRKLLTTDKTDLLTNFKNHRTGKVFQAYLVLKNGKIEFEFEKKPLKKTIRKGVQSNEKNLNTNGKNIVIDENILIKKISELPEIILKDDLKKILNLGFNIEEVCCLFEIDLQDFIFLIDMPDNNRSLTRSIRDYLSACQKEAKKIVTEDISSEEKEEMFGIEDVFYKIDKIKQAEKKIIREHVNKFRTEKLEKLIQKKIQIKIDIEEKRKKEKALNKIIIDFKNLLGRNIFIEAIKNKTFSYIFKDFNFQITDELRSHLYDRDYYIYKVGEEDIRKHPEAGKFEKYSSPKNSKEKIELEIKRGGLKYIKDLTDNIEELESIIAEYKVKFSNLKTVDLPYIDYLFHLSKYLDGYKNLEKELKNLDYFILLSRKICGLMCKFDRNNYYISKCLKIIERLHKSISYFDSDLTTVPVYEITWDHEYVYKNNEFQDIFSAFFVEWLSSESGISFHQKIISIIEDSIYKNKDQIQLIFKLEKINSDIPDLVEITKGIIYKYEDVSFPFQISLFKSYMKELGFELLIQPENKLNKIQSVLVSWKKNLLT